jgi:aspartate/tyrosine/aromatic aminotransferase
MKYNISAIKSNKYLLEKHEKKKHRRQSDFQYLLKKKRKKRNLKHFITRIGMFRLTERKEKHVLFIFVKNNVAN